MIKLVSFFVFLGSFIWTWSLFNSHDKINLATHAGIQSKLMLLIEDTIKTLKPHASDFEILSIYTEKIDDNQVSAHFAYKYSDQLEGEEKTKQTLSGEALLYRGLSENPHDEKWVAKSIKTSNDSIEFQQGLVVTPENTDQTAPNEATPAPETEEKTSH